MLHPSAKLVAACLLAVSIAARFVAADVPPSTTGPTTRDVAYRPINAAAPDAERHAASLDLYLPPNRVTMATLVWFHGGGLTGGDKKESAALATLLASQGIAVVSANYRLSPAAKFPAYLQDAAAAVAWAHEHAADLHAKGRPIFVGGYSAGGFLACALGTDARWLKVVGLSPADLRGIVAISPQVFTHYTIRAERGVADPEHTPLIDEFAPVFNASASTPPMCLFIGDHDTPTRREEVEYFMSVLHAKKNADATLTLVPDRNHGTMHGNAAKPGDPVGTGMIAFIQKHASTQPSTQPTP